MSVEINLSHATDLNGPNAGTITAPVEPFAHHRSRQESRAKNWVLIVSVMLVTLVVSVLTDFRLIWQSWFILLGLVAGLLVVAWFYVNVRRVDDGRIAETLHETALLAAYGPPAAALSYIVVAPAFPLMDAHFAAADLAMGFDWRAFYLWATERPYAWQLLSILYSSSLPHIGAVLIATGLTGRTSRTRELNTLLIATSLPMVLISGALPAMSAWIHHGLGIEHAYHLEHVRGLRDGSFRVLEVGRLEGIITFPSFHTAITLVLIWVCRGIPWLFWPTLILGIGQLISIPVAGGHYLVDMIAAAVVTFLVVLVIHRQPALPVIRR